MDSNQLSLESNTVEIIKDMLGACNRCSLKWYEQIQKKIFNSFKQFFTLKRAIMVRRIFLQLTHNQYIELNKR